MGAIMLACGRRQKSTGMAPSPVASPASKLASRPWAAMGWALSQAIDCEMPKLMPTIAMSMPAQRWRRAAGRS